MPTLTADQLFGTADQAQPEGAPAPSGVLSSAQLFPPDPGPPQSGAAFDQVWASRELPIANVLNAAGQGVSQAWGARPLGLDDASEDALRKAGIFNDYQTGHESFMKSVNEAIIRPVASLVDAGARAFPALATGAAAGLTQAAADVRGEGGGGAQPEPNAFQRVAGGALGTAGELAYGAAEGLIGPEFGFGLTREGAVHSAAQAEMVRSANSARAVGAIGEGEAGFYDATEPTPENVEARTEAAREAGVEPIAPEPPPPDIHALARRIDPDTFEQYDALALEREQHRATIAQLGEERANSPEALAAQDQVDTIMGRVNGVEARLTNAARERLAKAHEALDTALTDDSPEMRQARSALLDADFAMRDLAPDVSAAYRQARDMAPDLPVTAVQAEAEGAKPGEVAEKSEKATAEGEAQAGETQLTPEQEAGVRAAPVAAAQAETEGQPGNVVGEEKLGEPANPAEGPTETKPATGRGNLKAVEGTGETTTRGLAEGVEETAIEQGLTDRFGDLPEYRRVSMADQAARVTKLMDEDYENAKAVAMGTRQPPEGVLPESVFVGVEKRALAEGDVETLRALATRSRLTTAATTMGQRIRTLGERDASSPVGLIQEVTQAREAAHGNVEAAKAETVAEIRAEVAKAASGADKWASFLENIRCE